MTDTTQPNDAHERPCRRLGEWNVEPELHLLRRGRQLVRLEPRAMAVLDQLMLQPGQLLEKQHLIDAVWHTEFVTENALTRAIADLRKALGDDARDPRYIETIPRRGYRLIAAVEELPSTAAAGTSQRPRRLPTVVAAPAAIIAITLLAAWLVGRSTGPFPPLAAAKTSPRPRIVVLPFTVHGADDHAAFAAGLASEITSTLVESRQIQVISRTSADNFDCRGMTAGELGKALAVDYLLEGSIRWSTDPAEAGRARISLQLVRTADDVQLWTTTFDRSWDDLLGVQVEIAREVATRLGVTFAEPSREDEGEEIGDVAAYHAYVTARGREASANVDSLVTAVSLYERALELDPDFAQAAARLAMVQCQLVNFGVDLSRQRVEAAATALSRATALAPHSRTTLLAQVHVRYYVERDLEGARRLLLELARTWPDDVEILTTQAYVERRLGNWEKANSLLSRAHTLDPAAVEILWNLAQNLMALGDHPAAERICRRAVEIAPDARVGYWVRVINFMYWDDDCSRAREVLAAVPEPHDHEWWVMAIHVEMLDRQWDRVLELVRSRHDEALISQARVEPRGLIEGICLTALGRRGEAAAAAERARVWLDQEMAARPEDYRLPVARARVLALLDRREDALRDSRRAAEMLPFERDQMLGAAVLFDAARAAAQLGDASRAVAILRQLLAVPSEATPGILRRSADWDPIRDDAAFQALARGSASRPPRTPSHSS